MQRDGVFSCFFCGRLPYRERRETQIDVLWQCWADRYHDSFGHLREHQQLGCQNHKCSPALRI